MAGPSRAADGGGAHEPFHPHQQRGYLLKVGGSEVDFGRSQLGQAAREPAGVGQQVEGRGGRYGPHAGLYPGPELYGGTEKHQPGNELQVGHLGWQIRGQRGSQGGPLPLEAGKGVVGSVGFGGGQLQRRPIEVPGPGAQIGHLQLAPGRQQLHNGQAAGAQQQGIERGFAGRQRHLAQQQAGRSTGFGGQRGGHSLKLLLTNRGGKRGGLVLVQHEQAARPQLSDPYRPAQR